MNAALLVLAIAVATSFLNEILGNFLYLDLRTPVLVLMLIIYVLGTAPMLYFAFFWLDAFTSQELREKYVQILAIVSICVTWRLALIFGAWFLIQDEPAGLVCLAVGVTLDEFIAQVWKLAKAKYQSSA